MLHIVPHRRRCPTSRRCRLTGGGGGAPAPPYTRAVPPAPKNFPCMRGSGPLSSRGTHSAFSQEQSVTSGPSTGLERRAAHRIASRRVASRASRRGLYDPLQRPRASLSNRSGHVLPSDSRSSRALMTLRQVSIAPAHSATLTNPRAVFAASAG